MSVSLKRLKDLQDNPYERLYRKLLTPGEVAEMKFNLLGYLKTLIEMDKQYQEWLREKDRKGLHINDNE